MVGTVPDEAFRCQRAGAGRAGAKAAKRRISASYLPLPSDRSAFWRVGPVPPIATAGRVVGPAFPSSALRRRHQ